MIEIRVTPSEDGYELRLHGGDSDILKQLVGALKRLIPSFARRYDSYERCWHVKVEAAADLEEWLAAARRRFNVDVSWETPDGGGVSW